jgi:hypothetical protein
VEARDRNMYFETFGSVFAEHRRTPAQTTVSRKRWNFFFSSFNGRQRPTLPYEGDGIFVDDNRILPRFMQVFHHRLYGFTTVLVHFLYGAFR